MKKKPHRIAAPTSTYNGMKSTGDELRKLFAANTTTSASASPHHKIPSNTDPIPSRRPRRTSNNPSRVDNSGLKISRVAKPTTQAAPTSQKFARSAYDRVVLGLPDSDEAEAVPDSEAGQDNRIYYFPPNTIAPERPRAREAVYDPADRTLRVRFRNGGTYVYSGVTMKDARALERNLSFGKTLDRLIIGTYPFEKVTTF